MLTFLHGADFRLDSAFGGVTARQAAERRRESLDLPNRLADYVNTHGVDLVLLAGNLFDSFPASRETGERLAEGLGRMHAWVFAAPGCTDWYGPRTPWRTVRWPDNVTVFTEPVMTAVEVPELGVVVHGAAFTSPRQAEGLLAGFSVPPDGRTHIGLLHGVLTGGGGQPPEDGPCNPVRPEEAAGSGLTYLALGHVPRRGEAVHGGTLCAWPGCLEGRGFDETGERGFYRGTVLSDGVAALEFVPFARRRYEVLTVDVTDRDPLRAVHAALSGADTLPHLYRILLAGETGETGVDLPALEEALAGQFYALELRDGTCLREDVWERSGEDTLRGLFLRALRERLDAAKTGRDRRLVTMAARMGLAALDRRDPAPRRLSRA